MRLRISNGKICHDGFAIDIPVIEPIGLTVEAVSGFVRDANIGDAVRSLVHGFEGGRPSEWERLVDRIRIAVTVEDGEHRRRTAGPVSAAIHEMLGVR